MKVAYFKQIKLALLLTCCFTACKVSNPFTQRKQLLLVKPERLLAEAKASYREEISKNQICQDANIVNSVRAVTTNLVQAVNKYYTAIGQSQKLQYYNWEVVVIDNNDIVNATCRPGGKIIVYTGILPIAKNQDGLASIIGHEIAHALANHTAERLSQVIMAQLGGVAVEVATINEDQQVHDAWMQLYGVGAQFGLLLPYNRMHESESDKIGLFLMALAGYDPSEAPRVWERMMALGGEQPPEFSSTHPSHERRIRDLTKSIPESLAFAKRYGSPKTLSNSSNDYAEIDKPANHKSPKVEATSLVSNAVTKQEVKETLKDAKKITEYTGNDMFGDKITFLSSAKKTSGIHYKIQLTIVSNLPTDTDRYRDYIKFGQIDTEYLPNTNNYRIVLGPFPTKEKAYEVGCTVKKSFKNVFVEKYQDGNRVEERLHWQNCE